ncbi:MAG TPA: Fic family protein [Candidatus Nitrosotalea sp.]|nr:Fic family protein [Candidatus Nitrosotalea sp.]
MSEYFSKELINKIILGNEHIVSHRKESFGVNDERIEWVFSKANSFNDIKDKRTRIIKKATAVLGGTSWQQPFNNGNKTMAIIVTKYFLQKNGFDLQLSTDQEEDELIDLLIRTMYKFEDDPTIFSEIEEYLNRKVGNKN